MKVSDLTAELEVPASAVLEQCQRFSIDAAWAGAELSNTDVVILRAELAGGDVPLDLTEPAAPDEPAEAAPATEPAADAAPDAEPEPTPTPESEPEPEVEPEPTPTPEPEPEPTPEPELIPELISEPTPDAADAPADEADGPAPEAVPAPLPPTAVGSMPELIDEVTPAVPKEPSAHQSIYGGEANADTDAVLAEARQRNAARAASPVKQIDPSARNAPIVLVLGIILFAASNAVDNFFAVAALWLGSLIMLILALVAGIRGRRHAQTHPERLYGLWLGTITAVFAIAALIGLVTVASAVPREQPADQAPLGVGDLSSVQSGRWGYQRLARLSHEGWKAPARDAETCWVHDAEEKQDKNERVNTELAKDRVPCSSEHEVEVYMTFAVDRNADAAYPGADDLESMAKAKCGSDVLKAASKEGTSATLFTEHPTAAGWDDGDHDVSCVVITPLRKGSLTF